MNSHAQMLNSVTPAWLLSHRQKGRGQMVQKKAALLADTLPVPWLNYLQNQVYTLFFTRLEQVKSWEGMQQSWCEPCFVHHPCGSLRILISIDLSF
jgi:hypothetical protein